MRHWLKKIRENKNFTHEQVAVLSTISRSHYTQIEQGNKTPSVDVAKKIGATLEFDWVNFFKDNCSPREHVV